MVTKWKKSSINTVIVYVMGVSFLMAGTLGILNVSSSAGGIKETYSLLLHEDYQEGTEFSNFISYHLDNFLSMACGDYIGSYRGYVYESGDNEAVYQEGEEEEQVIENYYVENEEADYTTFFGENLSKKEKINSAVNFHNSIRDDKNLLYQISYEGKQLYSNMEELKWNGDENQLPSGYNFYLRFDGTKAFIKKDGTELDIYGDGIFRENEDWQIPGFQNFNVKEKWKKAEIVMLAAQEPVLYAESIYYADGFFCPNDAYYLYQNYKEARWEFCKSLLWTAAGALVLALYGYLKKEKGAAGKYIAKGTGHIWFECKVLLFLFLPIYLAFLCLQKDGNYWVEYAAEYVEEANQVPVGTYALEFFEAVIRSLRESVIWAVLIFWLLYLFICDLRYNKSSYKNGVIGKMIFYFDSKRLNLPLAKRMVTRTYGIFFVTAAQLMLFLLLLVHLAYYGYRSYYINADGWIDSYGFDFWLVGMFIAVTLTAMLLCLEYRYQKKNRQTAADLEQLSNRISGIHQGTYEPAKENPALDADVKKMSEELDEIRQGLETAVEERTRSERMKVELIANVSHDIKTPLTSIISYIQLLKQEKDLPDYILDYIRILDEKSQRLKNMVQDVFTVSKAASGQLSVELEELDLGKLIYQTLADMDECIQNSPVTIKTEIPKYPAMVQADGQRMYRVFQNLIGNAIKYSLEGSRVYITLKEEGEFVSASVKNTSCQELNQEIDFAERFTRGDQSRTDGGSGLGLSIAKSFTEACKGTFQLEAIADLFVVTITFRRLLHDME